jgi:hypothetical protein
MVRLLWFNDNIPNYIFWRHVDYSGVKAED